ncbi:MAG TPA: hypothetical protein VFG77_03365 [Nitrososphaeraceae archaeon]|jgi:hypothetical protein|nr:hypothetical protein [Nitrososphaeraceae archaeon]
MQEYIMFNVSISKAANMIQGWDEFLDSEIDLNHKSVVRNAVNILLLND